MYAAGCWYPGYCWAWVGLQSQTEREREKERERERESFKNELCFDKCDWLLIYNFVNFFHENNLHKLELWYLDSHIHAAAFVNTKFHGYTSIFNVWHTSIIFKIFHFGPAYGPCAENHPENPFLGFSGEFSAHRMEQPNTRENGSMALSIFCTVRSIP